jgi:multiple sugar transport system substrate-binding protein
MKRRLQKLLQRLSYPHILGLIFALIVGMSLLSAYSNQSIVTLSFVVPEREAPSWKVLSEQFHKNNPNIKISVNSKNPEFSDDVKRIYISDFQKKSPSFDLIYMDIIWVPEFAEKTWLMDLSQEFSQEELADFLPSEIVNGHYNKKLYRIPFRTDVGLLYYRKDWLDELHINPPETFKDLLTISQQVKKQKGIPYGYLWQGKPSEGMAAMFVEVLYGYGGFWINDQKKVGLNQIEAIKAVEFLRDTINQNISPKDMTIYEEKRTRSLFRDGKAVFMRNWPNVWLDVNVSEPSAASKIAITAMVHAEGKSNGSGGCKGGWGFGIAKSTKYKKEALQAIKFFTSAASQQKFTLANASVPSRPKLFLEPKIVAKYSHYPKLLNIIQKYSVARPSIPKYAEASCILQKYLTQALNPDKNGYLSPKEAMDAAARETQDLLNDKKINCQI